MTSKVIIYLFLASLTLTEYQTWAARRRYRKSGEPALTIGAFNIQRFGLQKIEKSEVRDIISKILSLYDISLVQEIVDKTDRTVSVILKQLNEHYGNGKNVFDAVVSPRVGRTMAKEQYAFIYRKDKVRLVGSFLFSDTVDHYEREPFVATFATRSTAKGLSTFTLMGIHIKPSEAVAELQVLHEAVEKVSQETTDDVVVMGDFNADCDYVRKKYWPTIPLWTNENYLWLIGDKEDTTSTPTDCAYDRIVLRGDRIRKAVITAMVFKFDEIFKLSNELTLAVSDHYPVQVQLSLSVSRQKN